MKTLAVNKKAGFDYTIKKTYTAGIILSGQEVKSVKTGGVNIKSAYVLMKDQKVEIIGCHIKQYKYSHLKDYDPDKTRDLLLNKKEIQKIYAASQEQGTAIVVTKILETEKGLIKVEIAEAVGKKQYEKKAVKKERDIARSTKKAFGM